MTGEFLVIAKEHTLTLEKLGFHQYENFLSPPHAVVVSEVRDRIVWLIRDGAQEKSYYLKLFRKPGANQPVRQILSGGIPPKSLADKEASILLWLQEKNFKAPRVAAYAARTFLGWERDSILMTESLEGFEPLDDWHRRNQPLMNASAFHRLARALFSACGILLRRLNDAGFDHPYPYFRHFFVPATLLEKLHADRAGQGIDPSALAHEIAIIDVHCGSILGSVSRTRRARALAEAFISSLKTRMTQTERLLFLKSYCGGDIDRDLLKMILSRARTKIQRHPNRYSWVREAIAKIEFPESFPKMLPH